MRRAAGRKIIFCIDRILDKIRIMCEDLKREAAAAAPRAGDSDPSPSSSNAAVAGADDLLLDMALRLSLHESEREQVRRVAAAQQEAPSTTGDGRRGSDDDDELSLVLEISKRTARGGDNILPNEDILRARRGNEEEDGADPEVAMALELSRRELTVASSSRAQQQCRSESVAPDGALSDISNHFHPISYAEEKFQQGQPPLLATSAAAATSTKSVSESILMLAEALEQKSGQSSSSSASSAGSVHPKDEADRPGAIVCEEQDLPSHWRAAAPSSGLMNSPPPPLPHFLECIPEDSYVDDDEVRAAVVSSEIEGAVARRRRPNNAVVPPGYLPGSGASPVPPSAQQVGCQQLPKNDSSRRRPRSDTMPWIDVNDGWSGETRPRKVAACVLCESRPVTHVLVPCGHPCLCDRCASSNGEGKDGGLLASTGGICPVAGCEFSSVMRFFGTVVED